MTEVTELADREAIRELYSRYCFYVDTHRPDLFAAAFVEDGVLWLSDRGSYRGREEIEAHVGRRAGKTFHLIHNVAIDSVVGDVAYSHAYFQLLDPATAACVAYGTYDDRLRRQDGVWMWHLKCVNYEFRSAEYAAGAAKMLRPDFGQPLEGVRAFGEASG
jgi:hypothetical protein